MLFQSTAAHFGEVLAESQERAVLLDFYAPWCAPCRTLAPELDAYSDANEARVSAYCVNIDTDAELAQRYGITAVPTVVVLQNGEVQARFEREISMERIAQVIQDI